MKRIIKFLMCLIFLSVLHHTSALAAEGTQQTSSPSGLGSVRRGVAVMMFAGLAGAVIGLSTLSFYGDPQEHTNNIWMGLGIGTAIGGVYVISPRTSRSLIENAPPTNPNQVARLASPLFQYEIAF